MAYPAGTIDRGMTFFEKRVGGDFFSKGIRGRRDFHRKNIGGIFYYKFSSVNILPNRNKQKKTKNEEEIRVFN